ncbi:11144_t:CDS:1, partial [Acaulospora colombiana]
PTPPWSSTKRSSTKDRNQESCWHGQYIYQLTFHWPESNAVPPFLDQLLHTRNPRMPQHRICRCSSCSSTTNGFRILSEARFHSHANLIAEPPTPFEEIVKEYQSYRQHDLVTSKLVFRKDLNTHPSTISAMLTEDLENTFLVRYELWHQNAINIIQKSPCEIDHDEILQNLLDLYSKVLSAVFEESRKRQNHTSKVRSSSDQHLSVQARQFIITSISQYQEPKTLAFLSPYPDHELSCRPALSYDHLGLDPKNCINRDTIDHLDWLNATLCELEENQTLPSAERRRMVLGLGEHYRNVISFIEAKRLQKSCPEANIRAIIT